MTNRAMLRLGALSCLLLTALALPVRGMHEEEGDPTAQLMAARSDRESDDTVSTKRHKIVIVDQDGEVGERDGEGEAFTWIRSDSPHRFRFRMPGMHLAEGGFLGVLTTFMTPELRLHFGAPEDAGVLISQVVEDSPAFAAGLRVGDVLTAVDGEPIRHQGDLLREIRRRDGGDSVSLDIVRDGKAQQLVAVLERTPASAVGDLSWAYRFDLDCEGGDDCGALELDPCDEGSDCEVKVECNGEVCVCQVDGESVECRALDLEHRHRD